MMTDNLTDRITQVLADHDDWVDRCQCDWGWDDEFYADRHRAHVAAAIVAELERLEMLDWRQGGIRRD